MGEINWDCHPDPDRKSGSGLEDALDASGLSGSRRQVHPDPDRKSGTIEIYPIVLDFADFLYQNSRKLAGKVEEYLDFPRFLSQKFEDSDSDPSQMLG